MSSADKRLGTGGLRALGLYSVLRKDPAEFLDRVRMFAASRLFRLPGKAFTYAVSDWESLVSRLGSALGRDVECAMREPELAEAESRILKRLKLLPADAPFGTFHNGDLRLARLCYGVVRAAEPKCVVETGVCYGITTAFILAALGRNRSGKLHSVDLPPLGRDGAQFVGWAIPDETWKHAWGLHRGIAEKILPPLLNRLGRVGLFIHDSLHTYRNMRAEFELVWPRIASGGVLISDDVQGNPAFQELSDRDEVAFHATVRELEKDSLLGIAVKRSSP